jgi:glycosyltransferase involved in cell wall biosynthesis
MRILVVADFFPWPPTNGGLLRLANSIEALGQIGEVELFSLFDERKPDRTVPATVKLARVGTTPYPSIDRSNRWRATWLAHRGVPMEVAMRSADEAPRRAFHSWSDQQYDLVWFSTAATYHWLGRPALGPTVIDFIDLEGEKEKQRVALSRIGTEDRGIAARARLLVARRQALLNARDWSSFQRSVAGEVDRVVLCSEVDVLRSGLSNAEVIVNTYPKPVRALAREAVGTPPRILFQGTFDYGPNVDGAVWLATELGPLIRSRLPGVEISLVGRASSRVDALHDPPRVSVVGMVPDMEPELARADLAVVPVRYGSGTRLKILESFAHRIPVVSTTIGAEGLDVHHGTHLLLADNAQGFAEACERVLVDQPLRTAMVTAAERLYLDRYQSSVAGQRIQALVHAMGVGQSSP